MNKTIGQNKTNDRDKVTILYQRLSKDDPNSADGESNSILNQRRMLEKYADDNGLAPYESVADDGFSGTGWARPGWARIVEMIEAGRVSCLVVKNLDRMGRDHLRVGLYMEQFQELGVRFVAINDGIDTARGEDDFTPFRAILAEWYAKDCSRKVKAVFQSKGNSGKPLCTQPIYGLLRDPDDKDKRILDPETAPIVRRIFQMTIEGIGPFQVAHIFCDEKIERPSYYFVRAGILPDSKRCDHDRKYNWDGSAVIKIIKSPAYKGDMVNFKTSKTNYKSKRYSFNPPEKWLVFEGYYPAIVDRETWELAQKLRKTKRKVNSLGAPNPLTGILFCGECGAKMSNRRGVRRNGDENGVGRQSRSDSYECSANRVAAARFISKCSLHFVTTNAVNAMILETIKHVALYARENEAEFAEKLREASTIRQANDAKENRRRLAKNERRIAELDVLFRKVYEDNAIGKLSDERFDVMSRDYEREQAELKTQSEELRALLDEYEEDSRSAERFLALARKYPDFDELTPQMLHEFVDKVYVHEAEKIDGERRQQIDIHLNFIGQFAAPDEPVPEPTPEEIAAAEKERARKQHLREYHKQWRDKRKAERDDVKADADIIVIEAGDATPKPAA
jgi:DNA invertase Pin-like site-specific DNA recombinase